MSLPPALEVLWRDLESVRAEVLKEVEGLSQGQADWRPGLEDWSVGEIVHHLTLAEVATGKLSSKLLKEAGAQAGPFPTDLAALNPLPPQPAGPAEAPEGVRPTRGEPIDRLLSDMKGARERSRQTLERLATVDVRTMRWRHGRLGELDLGQWWTLQAWHDGDHLQQIRTLKGGSGFPRA
ncbi:MAG TPA: DinB family protein [Candidatus Binatia bacterium]|nr:DinB family protein [Candidatus Binatia bacterium]